MLSILIPTYNQCCADLVQALYAQAVALDIPFEILVADDASTLQAVKEKNRAAAQRPCCAYLQMEQNVGPARIRNRLVDKARYDLFLLMDADTYPAHPRFLARYLEAARPNTVVCGGFIYERTAQPRMCRLRYEYGIRVEEASAEERNRQPYERFISMCFLADKATFNAVRFDEQMHFGYEDASFGIRLKQANVAICHIDNPVYHHTTDNAADYLRKIRHSIRNLLPHIDRLAPHIRLLVWHQKLQRLGMVPFIRALFRATEPLLVRNLTGNHPSLYLFAFYKLGYLCTLPEAE